MDSRTVVGGGRALHHARYVASRRVASRPGVVVAVGRSFIRSRELVPLSLSLPLFVPLFLFLSRARESRAAAPKLPEIIGFFCFPVIRRMARSLSVVPCHFYLSP